MKLSIIEEKAIDDIYVEIRCPAVDGRVERIVAALKTNEGRVAGMHEGATHLIDLDDVFYFESVDGKTFLYTDAQVLETALRLYEVEERLEGTEFLRISKQMVINFDKVRAIKPAFNAKLMLALSNGESVLASRSYASSIKRKIGAV